MWTQFWDMHSGGGLKEPPYHCIYIEAPSQDEAEVIFYNRFGHNPDRITCTCCGNDYSVSSEKSLKELTAFHRGCRYDDKKDKYIEEGEEGHYKVYMTLAEYKKQPDVLFISAKNIKPEEREGTVPQQGYVWME